MKYESLMSSDNLHKIVILAFADALCDFNEGGGSVDPSCVTVYTTTGTESCTTRKSYIGIFLGSRGDAPSPYDVELVCTN